MSLSFGFSELNKTFYCSYGFEVAEWGQGPGWSLPATGRPLRPPFRSLSGAGSPAQVGGLPHKIRNIQGILEN